MLITIAVSAKRREQEMAATLIKGFRANGDSVEHVNRVDFRGPRLGADLACFIGVKSRRLWEECKAAHHPTLLIDKGYFGRGEYYRFALGTYQPFYLDKMKESPSRYDMIGPELRPRVQGGKLIIFAGSSSKYNKFHGLPDGDTYTEEVFKMLNEVTLGTDFKLMYRPKPSWWDKESTRKFIPRSAIFSGPNESLAQHLPNAHCVVTHGSNAAVEAIAAGVPALILSPPGVSAVYDLAEHDPVKMVRDPFFPTQGDIRRRFANLAWCQFNKKEIESGFAWHNIRQWLNRG